MATHSSIRWGSLGGLEKKNACGTSVGRVLRLCSMGEKDVMLLHNPIEELLAGKRGRTMKQGLKLDGVGEKWKLRGGRPHDRQQKK